MFLWNSHRGIPVYPTTVNTSSADPWKYIYPHNNNNHTCALSCLTSDESICLGTLNIDDLSVLIISKEVYINISDEI